jgi:hypothetical protein
MQRFSCVAVWCSRIADKTYLKMTVSQESAALLVIIYRLGYTLPDVIKT